MSSHDRQRRASVDAPAARTRRPIQARLEVGPVDDPMEVEAEATADRVIAAIQATGGAPAVAAKRSPVSSIRRVEEEEPLQGSRIARDPIPVNDDPALEEEADNMGAKAAQLSRVDRAGAEEEAPLQGSRIARAGAEEEEPLQGSRIARASVIGAAGGAVDPELEARLTAGGGAPLPEPVRATMEHAFGADFSAVRVSENPAAADIGARAYTTGSDIRFAPGQFKPESTEGQHLLAHELTHVVQQGAAPAVTASRAVAQRDGGGAAPPLTLQTLLSDYPMQFRLFLRKNLAVENFDFLDAIKNNMERPALIRTFLADDAPMQVNVSSATRDAYLNNNDIKAEIFRPEILQGLESQAVLFEKDPEAMATLGLTPKKK